MTTVLNELMQNIFTGVCHFDDGEICMVKEIFVGMESIVTSDTVNIFQYRFS
jgi:hypothetical protein